MGGNRTLEQHIEQLLKDRLFDEVRKILMKEPLNKYISIRQIKSA